MDLLFKWFTVTTTDDTAEEYLVRMPMHVYTNIIGTQGHFNRRHAMISKSGRQMRIDFLREERKPFTRPVKNEGDFVTFTTLRAREIRVTLGFKETNTTHLIGIMRRHTGELVLRYEGDKEQPDRYEETRSKYPGRYSPPRRLRK